MATLTVGYGKTYSTLAAALTAASDNDDIAIYALEHNQLIYPGGITINKAVTIYGVLDRRQITFCSPNADNFTITAGATIRNLTFISNTSGNGNIYINSNNVTIDSCLIIGGKSGIRTDYATTITACMIFGCNTRNIFANTTATVNIFNCTSIAQYIFGQSGTICKNTVAVTDSGISAFTGSFNAASTNNATYDGTAPGSNAIDLGAINPHFIISETSGSNPFDYRVVPTSALIGAGVDSGITADIDNQAISGSFPVGCSNGIALSSYATAANVIEGVDRGDGTLGTYHEATTAEVQDGVLFGPSSSYEGTYDPITGNYTDPGVSNVINDTSYTFAADEKTGTYAPAPESKVELNYQYGAGGTEYTGSYSPSLPTAPTLTITDSADGTGGAYTIASGEVTALNKIYYFADAVDVSSTLIASRTGNGSGTVKITTMGTYWFYCITQTSGGYNISNLMRVTLTDGSDVSVSEEEDYIYDEGQQITVETRSQTIGVRGARTAIWTTANTIWGWKQPTSSAIRIKYEERGILVTSKVFVAENPAVTEGDRLDISGTKYLVRGVVDQSGTGTLWRIDCEEVK